MLITNIGVLVGSDGGDTLFLRGKEMSTIGLIENARSAPKKTASALSAQWIHVLRQNRENCVSTPRADIYSRRSATPTPI